MLSTTSFAFALRDHNQLPWEKKYATLPRSSLLVTNHSADHLRKSNEDLDRFLKERPNQQELVEKNILKDPKIAPALQLHAEELKRAKLEAALAHKIESRPSASQLMNNNILHASNVAPALQGKEAELKRSQLEDMLNTKIQERPSPDTLVEKHILEGQVV